VGQGYSRDVAEDSTAARHHADAALELAESDSWALSVRGLVAAYLDKDIETALTYFERALALNPSSTNALLWSSSAYAWQGKADEAIWRALCAIELSPFDPYLYGFNLRAGTAHAVAGQYDRAIEYCRRSLRANRMYGATHRILTISLALSGQSAAAHEAGRQLLALEPAMTVSAFRKRYPGSATEHGEQFCLGLAEAGIPA